MKGEDDHDPAFGLRTQAPESRRARRSIFVIVQAELQLAYTNIFSVHQGLVQLADGFECLFVVEHGHKTHTLGPSVELVAQDIR